MAKQHTLVPNARIDWLCAFLRTDFTALTQDQVQTLQAEAVAFIYAVPFGAPLPSVPRRLSRSAWESLATSVQNGIVALDAGNSWKLDYTTRIAVVPCGDGFTTSHTHKKFSLSFLANAMAVVQEAWPTLRRCPQCAALFRKVHKWRYCSHVCSHRYRWQKFIEKGRTRDYRREREQAATHAAATRGDGVAAEKESHQEYVSTRRSGLSITSASRLGDVEPESDASE